MHVGLIVSISLMALPLILAALMSTQSVAEIYDVTNLAPGSDAYGNYYRVMTDFNMWTYLINSTIMALAIVVGKVGLSLLAALALVYYDFPYKNATFMFVLFTLMLPVPVRIVPLFELMVNLDWTNTMLAITMPYLASATAVFLFRQHFMSIPASIVEAAKLDDVGGLRFLIFVLIPMSKGMIAGISVITYIYAWNQYLWPLAVISSQDQQVVQVGLKSLEGTAAAGQIEWGLIMAGAMIALVPPLVVLIVLHKPLLETFGLQQK
ncbi:ABC transporter permease subunit [Halalkaliarchaeum sp. AArc-GB]|uniref:carbohydrate ABC transporter permease n=1 Tax=Halalkaliarchaeum sp. AArc-GB TaxID=3074078 RepID=UPI002855705C|nr:ABC transporter permease subunit [Halalkaliarchaeum sp. AArc-GB]MDR5672189.1 ABC transporter permease subunit [Halalkaliarchaeum sp. AArc-GB]